MEKLIEKSENVENQNGFYSKNPEILKILEILEKSNFKFKFEKGANVTKNVETVSDYESEEEN